MATPLEDLDRILESINATERQRCFLRSFVQHEGVTGIRLLGPHTREEELFTLRISSVSGHLIAGTIGGRSVQIFIAANPGGGDVDLPYSDHMTIQTMHPNGRMEEYQTTVHAGIGAPYTVLYQDIEPGGRGRRVSGRWSMTWNSRDQLRIPGISPPGERHRQLDGYHACQIPISRSTRFEPLV